MIHQLCDPLATDILVQYGNNWVRTGCKTSPKLRSMVPLSDGDTPGISLLHLPT